MTTDDSQVVAGPTSAPAAPGAASSNQVQPLPSPESPAAVPPPSGASSTEPGGARGKVQVGTRRFVMPERPRRAAPQPAEPEEDEKPLSELEAKREERPSKHVKVPLPSRRDPLPADLEQELNAAFAKASLDQLVSAGLTSDTGAGLELESRHQATVIKIHGDNVFFILSGRNEGVASLRQFKDPPQVGATFDIIIRGFNNDEGLYELTVPGGSVDVHDWDDVVEGTTVEARVTGANTGGLECQVGGIRGFIPASQVAMFRVDNMADYYDKKLLCIVTEANPRKRNLVLSHRAVLEREKEAEREKLLAALQVGDVREGVVRSIRDFGAFVDLGGLDGLIHISQLSWDRVKHPSEVLQEGQKVRVKVEKIDPQTGKIGLSYRDLLEHPWATVEERFPVNALVKGTISRVAKFGAFVKLAPGIEGLIHISELAHHRVITVTNVVKEGEEVEVRVLAVDGESQRISLSLKGAHPLPEAQAATAAEEEADEPPPQPTVPTLNRPLKGGTSRATGGDKFGLNW